MKRKHNVRLLAGLGVGVLALTVLTPEVASAGTETIGTLASNITGSLSGIAKLIQGVAYVAGAAFAVGAIMKFKAHKDSPQQTPIGQPIALIFIAAALIFLPSVIKSTGKTVFGSSTAEASKPSGTIDFS